MQSKEDDVKTVIYWAKAARYQLNGFRTEKRDQQGRITQPDEHIQFEEHIYATSDPQAIKFIENSHAYKIGKIKKCDSAAHAAKLSEAHLAARAGVVTVENIMEKDTYTKH